MSTHFTICAFLAPALVRAAAFPWAGPEPTLIKPEHDNWTPAPTKAPEAGEFELFRRADSRNTCGFISGDSKSSITCPNTSFVCATNTFYGVHGCCDPNGLSTCTLATTCIPSSALSTSCTGDCSKDPMVAKCIEPSKPNCYEHRYIFGTKTIMTEYGCAASPYTLTLFRTLPGTVAAPTSLLHSDMQASASQMIPPPPSSSSSSLVSTDVGGGGNKGKDGTPIGAIVGGVVGGLAVIGAVGFAVVWIVMRDRRVRREGEAREAKNVGTLGFENEARGPEGVGVMGYVPQHSGGGGGNGFGYGYGYPGYTSEDEQVKAWQGQGRGQGMGMGTAMEHEGVGLGLGFGMGMQPLVVEAEGRPVERVRVHEVP